MMLPSWIRRSTTYLIMAIVMLSFMSGVAVADQADENGVSVVESQPIVNEVEVVAVDTRLAKSSYVNETRHEDSQTKTRRNFFNVYHEHLEHRLKRAEDLTFKRLFHRWLCKHC